MNRVEDLPPEAEKERQLCLLRGMKSLLAVPMLSEGKTWGPVPLCRFVRSGSGGKNWSNRFRLISEGVCSALERKRAEREAI